MSNRDDGWQWLLLGAAIAAFDYWRRYTMYADTVRPYGTAGGFNIFVEQYHSIKRSNPRLAPKAAAWCLAGGIILGAFAIGTHVGGVGVIAYVLLALAL